MKKNIYYLDSDMFKSLDKADFNFIILLMQIGEVYIENGEVTLTLPKGFKGRPDDLMKILDMPPSWNIINIYSTYKIVLICAKILPESILNHPINKIHSEKKKLRHLTLEW